MKRWKAVRGRVFLFIFGNENSKHRMRWTLLVLLRVPSTIQNFTTQCKKVNIRIWILRLVHHHLIHIRLGHPIRRREWKVAYQLILCRCTFFHNVAELCEVDDVGDTTMQRLGPPSQSQLWIPLVGRHVAGNDHMMRQELQPTAFGLDLVGISIKNPEKVPKLPVAVELLKDEGLVLQGTIARNEIRRRGP